MNKLRTNIMTNTIAPEELAKQRRSGKVVDLVDVRTPVEYREVHVDFARNVPLNEFDVASLAREHHESAVPLYVICRSGNRASQACEQLAAAGISAVSVEGGTLAWDAAGLPVVRGKKAMSLERQVRILIGGMVLASSLLAYFIHPCWIGLTAFFGGGLIFSGITDFCGLALILARMPWNQVRMPLPIHLPGRVPVRHSGAECHACRNRPWRVGKLIRRANELIFTQPGPYDDTPADPTRRRIILPP